MEEALRLAFGSGWEVRAQAPLALDDESEPEPDVAVVPGSFRDYVLRHPSQPVLLVEVSDSSLLWTGTTRAAFTPGPASPTTGS